MAVHPKITVRRSAPEWTFGDRLRKVRRDVLGMTQPELAAALGINRQQLAAYETDRVRPRHLADLAHRLEALSGVDQAWFLSDTEPNPLTRTTVILFDEGTQND